MGQLGANIDRTGKYLDSDFYEKAPVRVQSTPGTRYTAIAAGVEHTCAVTTDGFVECFGGSAGRVACSCLAWPPSAHTR